MTKIWKICKKDLSNENFSKNSASVDNLDSRCKSCLKQYKKNLYANKKSKEYKIYDFDMNSTEWQVGKPKGGVTKIKEKYRASTYTKDGKKKDKIFSTREEAETFVHKTSHENGQTKNMIRKVDDYIEVKIDDDHIMKTDIKFLDLCQSRCICKSKGGSKTASYYPKITIDGKTLNFHKYITNFKMTDHINRDTFDNRLQNLRETTHKQNNNNRGPDKKYDSNHIMGIRYVQRDNAWQARIKQDGKEYSKQFSVKKFGENEAKELAIKARNEFISKFNSNNN